MTAQLVYSDQLVRIFNGDARELPLDDATIGQIITSPPYNCRARYDGYDDWLPWEEFWHGLIEPALKECLRVLVPGGRLCVNFANVIRQNVPDGATSPPDWQYQGHWRWTSPGAGGEDWAALVDEHFFPLARRIGGLPRERLTWVKGDSGADVTTSSTAWGSWMSASNPVLRATSEPIFIIDKESHKRGPGTTDITADEFKRLSRNTWFIPVRGIIQGRGANPCQMPPEVARCLMKFYGYVEDVVLDPFAGEGTTLRAAKDLGRQCVGVEQGAKQCERAAGRCRQEVMPMEIVA